MRVEEVKMVVIDKGSFHFQMRAGTRKMCDFLQQRRDAEHRAASTVFTLTPSAPLLFGTLRSLALALRP